jgi:hypothetical protein
LPPRARDAARAFNSSPRPLTASSFHGKPLAVLSAGVGEMRGWAAAQNKLARLSTSSTHRTVADATHAALLEDKKFANAAAGAIGEVVSRTRSRAARE